MPRAELHYALALDSEIWEASRVDASLLDPVVRVEGGLPGIARQLTVVRDYQGPVGSYTEHFVLRDPQGRQLAESPRRRMRLSGQMWEDRVVSQLSDVLISSADEHQLSLYVNDDEVGTVPVFVEAGLGGDQRVAAQETLKKALGKGAVLWLTVPQPVKRTGFWGRNGHKAPEHTQAVWFVFEDGKVYVFNGPTEQEVPGLAGATEVTLTARSKDLRSQVSQLPAKVRIIPGDDELFTRIGRAGLGRRLNLPDGDGALERWRERCTLVELTPVFGEEPPSGQSAPGATDTPQLSSAQAAAPADAEAGQAPARKAPAEDIHVEAQVDQAVFDRLVAEGASERVARAKAKAAYVRAEKARIRSERAAS